MQHTHTDTNTYWHDKQTVCAHSGVWSAQTMGRTCCQLTDVAVAVAACVAGTLTAPGGSLIPIVAPEILQRTGGRIIVWKKRQRLYIYCKSPGINGYI